MSLSRLWIVLSMRQDVRTICERSDWKSRKRRSYVSARKWSTTVDL